MWCLPWEIGHGVKENPAEGNMDYILVKCSACGVQNRIADSKQHLLPRCGKCKETLNLKEHVVPVDLGDGTLDAFLQTATLPVVVDFYSPSCGPCTSLAPLLARLTRQFFGKIIVAKVDTGKNPGCSAHFRIRGVPTLIFFKNGQILEEIVGLPDAGLLQAKMDYYGG